MPFYLSEYIGSGTKVDPFRPVGSDQPGWSAIDIRPDASRLDGGGLNACLLHVPSAFSDPLARFLADDKLESLTNPQKNFLQNKLNIDLSSPTLLRDIIATLMTNPPVNGWKGIRPGLLKWEIWLGGLLWDAPRISGGASDDFNRPDESPISTSGGWSLKRSTGSGFPNTFSIVSNKAQSPGDAIHFYTGAAKTADQYAELIANSATNPDGGPSVRIDTNLASDTWYTYDNFFSGGEIWKVVSGSITNIVVHNASDTLSTQIRLEVEGTTLRLYYAGIQSLNTPVTDTSISTGQPGMFGYNSTHPFEDWKGGDLGTVAVAFPVVADADDGTGYRQNTSWASIGSGTFTAESVPELWISKFFSTPDYTEDIAFLEIDTSGLPDMATVVRATLKEYVLSRGTAQAFHVVGDYYHFGGEPSVAADWIQTANPNIFTPGAEPVTGFTANAWNTMDVIELGGINKFGYTGIRLTFDDFATPTGDTHLEFASSESSEPPFTLDIDYVLEGHWARDQARVSQGSTSQTLAFPNDVKAGTLLLACFETENGSAGDPSDSRGNTWNQIQAINTANGQRVAWYYAISQDAGPCTVTFDLGVNFVACSIAEFSTDLVGTITLDAFDSVYRSTTGAATDKFSTASVTAAQADSLAISFLGTDTNSNDDVLAGTNCYLDSIGELSDAGSDFIAMEHKVVGAGSVALPWTTEAVAHGGNFDGQVHIAVFKVVSGTPAGDAGPTLIRLIGNRQTW